jgi:hypothetical protein
MPYVMVPVPEEHVEEVMQFVLRAVARASVQPWDLEGISQLWDEVDELSRALLSYVSRATVADKDLAEGDVAAMMQLSVRETIAIMREVNEVARQSDRPNLIFPRTVAERLPNGRTMEKRVLFMEDDVADLLRQAEEAERSSAPNVPGGEP